MKSLDRHKLRNLRLLKGYSLSVMARLISSRYGFNLSKSAISNWETGRTKPSLDSLIIASDLFQVPLDYFLSDESNCLFDENIGFDESKSTDDDDVHPSLTRISGNPENFAATLILESAASSPGHIEG